MEMSQKEKQNLVDIFMRDFKLSYTEALLKVAEVEGVHPYQPAES